jgi:hypothetical protein
MDPKSFKQNTSKEGTSQKKQKSERKGNKSDRIVQVKTKNKSQSKSYQSIYVTEQVI